MKVILPDTNIILWTFKNGPDFREEIGRIAPDYSIMIPTCIIDELEKLDTKESRAALRLCESVENIDIGSGYADDLLVSAAEEGYLIATNDIEILNKLKSKRINALRIREKTKLIHTEVDL